MKVLAFISLFISVGTQASTSGSLHLSGEVLSRASVSVDLQRNGSDQVATIIEESNLPNGYRIEARSKERQLLITRQAGEKKSQLKADAGTPITLTITAI